MGGLIKIKGALPFLIAAFFNAFIDLGHKIIIQNTIFKVYSGEQQVILTAIVNSLILIPFILLFIPSGFIADKYPKHRIMRTSAWFSVFLTLGITLFYALGWFWVAFCMTCLLAVQSTFYSPAKYAYLRGLFGKQHLAESNGLLSAVTIIAILMATFVFSIVFEMLFPQGEQDKSLIIQSLIPVGVVLVLSSVLVLILVHRLPQTDTGDADKHFDRRHIVSREEVLNSLSPILSRSSIRLSIIGLAMFWSLGQIILAVFPAFVKQVTGETNTIVIQATLALVGLGIAAGSMMAGRLSRNYIELGLLPVAAVGVAICMTVLPFLRDLSLMAVMFFLLGCAGGMFIVPLNAMVQFYADEKDIGRVLAGNNLIQNVAMFSCLLLTVSLAFVGVGSQHILHLAAIAAIVGGIYTVIKLPQSLVSFILSYLLQQRYSVTVQGMKNIPSTGGVLMLGNHISWIDWAILQIASPRPVQFVMIKSIYQRWYLKWFFDLFGCIPISPGASSRSALDKVTTLLNEGKVVCLFPEGVISRTGHLSEFRRGYERAVKEANDDVVILPFYLRGLWGSQFSRSSERLKSVPRGKWKRDIIVAFGQSIDKSTTADVLKRRVFDLSIVSWEHYVKTLPTLPEAWIQTVKHQKHKLSIADTLAPSLSAYRALTAAISFSRRIKKLSPERNIGLLLPTSAGGMLANMATLLCGKTIVNLNYTANEASLLSAIDKADIKTIYTSERFLTKLKKRGIDINAILDARDCSASAKPKLVYLEQLRTTITTIELLGQMVLLKCLPTFMLKRLFCQPAQSHDVAVILFSSGSEGSPKGVQLSHQNIMANLKQVADVLNTEDSDLIMASLPLFHAFGLTVTQFMPLIEGIPLVCHADPTDALGVAKAVAKHQATIMCGTSTFLRLYTRNKKVQPLMFESLRAVVAGAERLNPDVRTAFKLKFNKDIYEGYGATETTPVASTNLPNVLDTDDWKVQIGGKQGTVGMPLPGSSFRIVDPDSFDELATGESGMILIGGIQVMLGYLKDPDKTADVIKHVDAKRWYVTGDKGFLDEDGFLTIVDRYSRFAKVGGEMISLSAVERSVQEALHTNYPDLEVVAVSIANEKKGEEIVLLCEEDISLQELKSAMLAHGVQGLMIPSTLLNVEALPKLGSGKTDFSKAKQLSQELMLSYDV